MAVYHLNPSIIAMFCPECGTKIEEESARFCPGCGHAFTTPAVTTTVKPATFPAEAAQVRQPVQTAAPGYPAAKPGRRLSGCAIAAIIGGALFILGTIGIVALFWLISAATSPASNALEQHFAMLRSGNVEGAYQMTTAQSFRSNTSLEQFIAFVNKNPGVRQIASTSYSSRNIENNQATFEGTVTLDNGVKTPFQADLVKEGDTWKIHGLNFNPAAQP